MGEFNSLRFFLVLSLGIGSLRTLIISGMDLVSSLGTRVVGVGYARIAEQSVVLGQKNPNRHPGIGHLHGVVLGL
jgi:hypothetical protein